MNRKLLTIKMQAILLRRRDALRQSLAADMLMLGRSRLTGVHDSYDDAQESADDAVVSQLAQSESRELRAIENALERMREGNYGVCEECGHNIPMARLQALPYAILCVGCQRGMERHDRTSRLSANWSGVIDFNDEDDFHFNDFGTARDMGG